CSRRRLKRPPSSGSWIRRDRVVTTTRTSSTTCSPVPRVGTRRVPREESSDAENACLALGGLPDAVGGARGVGPGRGHRGGQGPAPGGRGERVQRWGRGGAASALPDEGHLRQAGARFQLLPPT